MCCNSNQRSDSFVGVLLALNRVCIYNIHTCFTCFSCMPINLSKSYTKCSVFFSQSVFIWILDTLDIWKFFLLRNEMIVRISWKKNSKKIFHHLCNLFCIKQIQWFFFQTKILKSADLVESDDFIIIFIGMSDFGALNVTTTNENTSKKWRNKGINNFE